MTDREPVAPADPTRPSLVRPRAAVPDGPNANALLKSAPRSDGLPMFVTLATRTQPRTTTEAPPVDPLRAWLASLPADLPAFTPAALDPTNRHHAPAEALAAARAAACPDLFIVHAPDQAAGERVIAAAARLAHERVLVLSPDPAAADRIVERLAKAGASVVRALADDENPIRPSPVVAKATSAAMGAGRAEQLNREAAAALAEAEAQLHALGRLAELDAEIADLTARLGRIEQQVRAESDPIPSPGRRALEVRLASLREHLAAAAKKPGLFARLLGKVKHDPQAAAVEKELHTLEAEIAALDAAASAEWETLVAREIEARRAKAEPRLTELIAVRERLRAEAGPAAPATRETAEAQLAAARARLADCSAPDFIRRLLAGVGVVVGTPGSLEADPVFDGSESGDDPPFGRLILDRAEELTEPDFLRLAKLASRSVLVGDTAAHAGPQPHLNGSNGRGGRGGRPAEVPFVARLARLLDRETWTREGERLVCRLAHPTADERRAM